MTFTHAVATNNYGPAKFIVSPSAANGTHTTISAALAVASSGDTIFVRPGTYTENPTATIGVNVTAYQGDDNEENVTVVGSWTVTGAGTFTMSNLCLKDNGSPVIAFSGSTNTVLQIDDCTFIVTGASVFNYTNSGSSQIVPYNCVFNVGTGHQLYSMTSAGNITFESCEIEGSTSTASNNSAGLIGFITSSCAIPLSTSGTGQLEISNTD